MQFGVFLGGHNVDGSRSPTQVYEELLEQAVHADGFGYDYVWIPEQALVSYIIVTDLLQLTALIAQRTSRIKIGSAILITAWHHPLRLAGAITQVDHLTRGRFEPGFGRGALSYTLKQLQAPLRNDAESQERFDEFIEIVQRAWGKDEAFEFSGKHFQFEPVYVLPRPYSMPHPRIWTAATRPQSAAAGGAKGLSILFTPYRNPFGVVEEAYAAFVGAGGHQEGPHGRTQMAVNRLTYVAHTREEARAFVPWVREIHRISSGSKAGGETVVKGMRVPGASPTLTEDEIFQNLIVGDPGMVVDHVGKYHELGVDQLISYTAIGQSQREILRSMELFAKHVIPAYGDAAAGTRAG